MNIFSHKVPTSIKKNNNLYLDYNHMQRKDNSTTYLIRESLPEDIQGMLEVFNYYVENSFAAYFETAVGPDFFKRLYEQNGQNKSENFPLYVIEGEGKILGIGALRPYLPFPNFMHTGILSYFILPEYTRKGMGTGLLDILCQEAQIRKMKTLLVNVSSKNEASLSFHIKNGFVECGKLKAVGTKFGECFDIVWLQKFLEESPKKET
jgi:phosphinothricin acetyltransferase